MLHMEPPCVTEMDLTEDIRQEFERAIEGLEWAELNSMLEGAVNDLLNPTATPPPPLCFPAEPPASPQPAADSFPAFMQHALQMTAPPTTQPAQLYSQPGTVSQGQNLLQQWPVHAIPTSATVPPPPPCFPAEPPTSSQPAADSFPAFMQHTAQMTVPPTTQPAQLYSQPRTVSQGQNLLQQWPVHAIHTSATVPPPPLCFPAEPPTSSQPAADSFPAFMQHALQMTAPPTTQPAQLYSQPGTVSQGQNLLQQWPVHAIHTSAIAPPAAPANPCNNILQIPDSMLKYLRPVGVLNGMVVCDFASNAAPLNATTPTKRKRQDEQDGEYIKKPPNAFMIFLKEQRPKVKAEMKVIGSAAVNAVVGERWKSLSKDQQATYYEQAEQQRRLHAQKHPDWSSKDNYGKTRKKTRRFTYSTESTQHKRSPAFPVYSPSFPTVAFGLEFTGH